LDGHHEPEDEIKVDTGLPTVLDTAGMIGMHKGQNEFKSREKSKSIKNREITPNALEIK
jgi:hypothetical protein